MPTGASAEMDATLVDGREAQYPDGRTVTDKFEDLRTFVTAVSSGGVNAAAVELGIAKSAVSRRISDLEHRLGVGLVDRSGKRFQATATGLDYARRARAILDALEQLDSSLRPTADRTPISLSATHAVLLHLLIPSIGSLAETEGGDGVLLRMAGDEAKDADLRFTLRETAHGPGRSLLTSPLVVCAAPDHLRRWGVPERIADLDQHPVIAIGDLPAAEWLFGKRRWSARIISMLAPNDDAAACAAAAGLGLARLPEFVVAPMIADGMLSTVLGDEEESRLHLFVEFADQAPPHVLRLVDAVAKALDADR